MPIPDLSQMHDRQELVDALVDVADASELTFMVLRSFHRRLIDISGEEAMAGEYNPWDNNWVLFVLQDYQEHLNAWGDNARKVKLSPEEASARLQAWFEEGRRDAGGSDDEGGDDYDDEGGDDGEV